MNRKVVIITGASSGMGMEAAYCLIEKGCKVYACARRTERMQPIKERGGEVISLDVRDEASMVNCVNLVLEKEGRIDVLINNAGYGCGGAIEDVPMEEKQSLLAQGKLLKPKLDVVFHALFREDNKELLGALTSDILREEVKIKTTDKNRYVDIEEANDKLGVMNLRAELEDGAHCIIEIQIIQM